MGIIRWYNYKEFFFTLINVIKKQGYFFLLIYVFWPVESKFDLHFTLDNPEKK